mmetsp:Transcript_7179/g.27051  ORF Transcript_7179/g.27051 Transcript_7179/m.27051 type:complete len:211 (-) Transcript_7179:1233-1865(-)
MLASQSARVRVRAKSSIVRVTERITFDATADTPPRRETNVLYRVWKRNRRRRHWWRDYRFRQRGNQHCAAVNHRDRPCGRHANFVAKNVRLNQTGRSARSQRVCGDRVPRARHLLPLACRETNLFRKVPPAVSASPNLNRAAVRSVAVLVLAVAIAPPRVTLLFASAAASRAREETRPRALRVAHAHREPARIRTPGDGRDRRARHGELG